MAYSSDALRQTVEILVRAGGLNDVAQLTDALVGLQANMVNVARSMVDEGRSAAEVAAEISKLASEHTRLSRVRDELAKQTSLADSFVGIDNVVISARSLADELTKVDVSLAGVNRAAMDFKSRAIDADFKAQAQAAREAKQAFLDGVMPLEQLNRAALDFKSQRIDDYYRQIQEGQDGTSRKSQAVARGVLEMTRAFEDFSTGGFLGVLNNIPGIIDSFGRAAGLATTQVNMMVSGVSVLATGAFILYKNWDSVLHAIGMTPDIAGRAVATIDDLKTKIDDLTKMPHKMEIDYTSLAAAKKLLDDTREALAAFESAKKGDVQQEMAKQAQEVTGNLPGGSKQLFRMVKEADEAKGIDWADPEIRKKFEQLQGAVDRGRTDMRTGERYAASASTFEARDAALNELRRNIDENIKAHIGKFELGDETAMRMMQARAASDPNRFNVAGLGGVTATEAMRNLPSSRQEMQRRMDQDLDDKDQQEKDKADIEAFKKRKKDREEGQKAEEGAEKIFGHITEAGAKASDAAMEADKKKLDLTLKNAGQADKDADAAKAAADRDAAKAQRERDAAAKKLLPGFEDKIQAEMLENQRRIAAGFPVARSTREFNQLSAMGMQPALPPDAQRRMLEQRVGADLRRGRQDPTLGHEIVGGAAKNLDEQAAKASAGQARTLDMHSNNQMLIATLIQQNMQRTMQAQQKAMQANAMLRKAANSGPSGQRMGGMR